MDNLLLHYHIWKTCIEYWYSRAEQKFDWVGIGTCVGDPGLYLLEAVTIIKFRSTAKRTTKKASYTSSQRESMLPDDKFICYKLHASREIDKFLAACSFTMRLKHLRYEKARVLWTKITNIHCTQWINWVIFSILCYYRQYKGITNRWQTNRRFTVRAS